MFIFRREKVWKENQVELKLKYKREGKMEWDRNKKGKVREGGERNRESEIQWEVGGEDN